MVSRLSGEAHLDCQESPPRRRAFGVAGFRQLAFASSARSVAPGPPSYPLKDPSSAKRDDRSSLPRPARHSSTMRRTKSDTVMPNRSASARSTSYCGLVSVTDWRTVVAMSTNRAPHLLPRQGRADARRRLKATVPNLRQKRRARGDSITPIAALPVCRWTPRKASRFPATLCLINTAIGRTLEAPVWSELPPSETEVVIDSRGRLSLRCPPVGCGYFARRPGWWLDGRAGHSEAGRIGASS